MKILRDVIEATFIGVIESLAVKLAFQEMRWTKLMNVFVVGTLLGLFVLEIIKNRKGMKVYINNRFNTKIRIKNVKGFFGRDEVVEEIISWHRSNVRFQIGVIYGFGGSGKTRLASEFGKSANNYCYSILVSNENSLPKMNTIYNNTVIFIDYVYEFVKDKKRIEEIEVFLDDCRRSDKRISIILLERTNLIGHVLYMLNINERTIKKIDLNERSSNNVKILEEIFRFRLGDSNKIEGLVSLITDKFDCQYSRPIFAHIMSDLIGEDSQIDFTTYNGRNMLIEEYWNYRLKRKNLAAFLYEIAEYSGRQEDVATVRTLLTDKTEAILLFSILTSFTITIDDTFFERKITVKYRNGDLYENPELIRQLNNVLTIGRDNIKIRNRMLLYMFPIEKGQREVNKIEISVDTYDIISSWLLTHFISRSESGNAYLISLIKCVNLDVGNIILSFVSRSGDDDKGASLLWWQKNFFYDAFDAWDENGYEEWLKNCFELYEKAEEGIRKCITELIKHFISKMKQDSKRYASICRYIWHIENDLRFKGKIVSANLVKKLDMQCSFNEINEQGRTITMKRSEQVDE